MTIRDEIIRRLGLVEKQLDDLPRPEGTSGTGISGSGTVGRVAAFTAATAIGDSQIDDSIVGGVLDLSAALTANRTITINDLSGTMSLGAGTITSASANDATVANHTHALDSTNPPAGAYGSATEVGTFTVDAKGRITVAADVTISGVTPSAHDLLSAQHGDTIASTPPTQGSIIAANAGALWNEVAHEGSAGHLLQTLTVNTLGWSNFTISSVAGNKAFQFFDSITLISATDPLTVNFPITAAQTTVVTSTSDGETNVSTLLAGDANGRLRLDALGIGGVPSGADRISISERIDHLADADTYMTFSASDQWQLIAGGVTMIDVTEDATDTITLGGDALIVPDNFVIGLAASGAGRIGFDDQATDEIFVLDALFGVGTSSPNTIIDAEQANDGGATTIRVHNTDTNGTPSSDESVAFNARFYRNSVAATRDAGNIRFGKENDWSTAALSDSYVAVETVLNGAAAAEVMRATSAGRVGVKTVSPSSILHTYENTTNTGTNAGVTIEQDSTGDPVVQFLLSGTQRWVAGIDNSDSDKWKVARSANLNTDAVLTITTTDRVGIDSVTPEATLEAAQNDASGAIPVFRLDQTDLSEEYIDFVAGSTGAGDPVDTSTAVGTAYARLRVAVNGTFKYIQLYNA